MMVGKCGYNLERVASEREQERGGHPAPTQMAHVCCMHVSHATPATVYSHGSLPATDTQRNPMKNSPHADHAPRSSSD